MPRVEGRVTKKTQHDRGVTRLRISVGREPGDIPLNLADDVVVYTADDDPVAEYDNALRHALTAAWQADGDTYASVGPAGHQFRAIVKPSDRYADGPTALAAAQALLARLQAQQQKPVGEMTEAEKVSELLDAGWELSHLNTTIDPGIISLSITCRETRARITAFDETLSAILTKLLASARNLREEASQ